MRNQRAKLGRGPGLLVALAASAFACSTAAAQLPELPRLDPPPPDVEPVRQAVDPVLQALDPALQVVPEPVREAVREPLPGPVEEVAQSTPAGPVVDEVRETVGGSNGGDVNGGGGGGTPDPAAASGAGPGAGAGQPDRVDSTGQPGGGSGPVAGGGSGSQSGGGSGSQSGGGSGSQQGGRSVSLQGGGADAQGGGGSDPRQRGGGGSPAASAPGPGAGAGPAATAPPTPAESSRPTADRGGDAADSGDKTGLARTVERIVKVVPGVMWVALAALLVLALALGARALVDNRRARALRREREALLRDMGLLERVLLPQVPERLGDLAASVAYRPAAGPAAGGDFYDVFELPDGRVAILVGDISGHGREALERTSSLRPTLRAHLEAGMSPRAALQSAGRAAGTDASGGFTTVVAAVHDPSSGRLTYAAAGHPPPVLVGPGAHEPVTAASAPPIGLGLRTGVRQTTVPLPRGSAACFFTDGLLEARSGGALLGLDWLAGVVAEFGPLDSAAALLDRVTRHADETPDDMTACLVRAVAGPEESGPRVEELELEPDEVRSAGPLRFLAACGLSAEAGARALAEAGRAAGTAGTAVLTVTIDDRGAVASVTAPTPDALATT